MTLSDDNKAEAPTTSHVRLPFHYKRLTANKIPDRVPATAQSPVFREQDLPLAPSIHVAFVHWCEVGDLDEVKKIAYIFSVVSEDVRMKNNAALHGACRNGNLHVAQWLTSKFELTSQDVRSSDGLILAQTTANGHLTTVQWMIEKFNLTRRDVIIRDFHGPTGACANGHLALAKWLHEKYQFTRPEIFKTRMFPFTCYNGFIESMEWCARTFNIGPMYVRINNCEALRLAATSGLNPAAARWIIETYNLTVDDIRVMNNEIFVRLCGNGEIVLAKWIANRFRLTARDARCRHNEALKSACASGHLEMVQWLVGNFGLTAADTHETKFDKSEMFRDMRSESSAVASQWMVEKFGADSLPPEIVSHVKIATCTHELPDYIGTVGVVGSDVVD